VKQGGGSVMVWAAISWYSNLLVPFSPFMTESLKGVCGQIGQSGASLDPDVIPEQ
jgi:hypothetical protein